VVASEGPVMLDLGVRLVHGREGKGMRDRCWRGEAVMGLTRS
jgi:hypothetical protein